MEKFDKNKILYVPYNDNIPAIKDFTCKPRLAYLDYIDKYGVYWVKYIVPNTEMYINDKPWYEVKKITALKTQKEFDNNPHTDYKQELKKFYYFTASYPRNKDWVYEKLCNNELVVMSYKNLFYVDNSVKQNGGKYECTDTFRCYSNNYSPIKSSAERYAPNKVFNTYEECKKYITYKAAIMSMLYEYSDEDYSLQDACFYLKTRGFNAEQRHGYLKAMQAYENFADAELSVRDGKVYINRQVNSEIITAPIPECAEDIKRSSVRMRKYVEECNNISRNINWYVDKKELII